MNLFTSPLKKSRKAIIVYATGSGNAQLVAESLYDGLDESGVKTVMQRAEQTSAEQLLEYDLISLVCSTWDVGKLNPYFVKLNGELQNFSLENKLIDIIGLGDSVNYDIFCGAADIIEETIKTTGADTVLETLRVDGPPHKILKEIKQRGRELAKLI